MPGRRVSAPGSGLCSRTAEPRRQGSAPVFPVSGRERRVRVYMNDSGRAFPSPSQSPSPGPGPFGSGRTDARPARRECARRVIRAATRRVTPESRSPRGPSGPRESSNGAAACDLPDASRSPLDPRRLSRSAQAPVRSAAPHHRVAVAHGLSRTSQCPGGRVAFDAVRQGTHFKGRARPQSPPGDPLEGPPAPDHA